MTRTLVRSLWRCLADRPRALPGFASVLLLVTGCGSSQAPASRTRLGSARAPLSAVLSGAIAHPNGGTNGCPAEQGIYRCNGRCVNLESDAANCGQCGTRCRPEQTCTLGMCSSAGPVQPPAPRDPGTWYSEGPYLGGRLDGVTASTTNVNGLIVGSPGGGAYYSTTSPASWSEADPSQHPLSDFTVVDTQWDAINVGTRMFASTWSDLYATTDFGNTWTNLTSTGAFPAPLMPLSHAADPKPLAQLKFSTSSRVVLWSKPCTGLWYSYDGSNFTQTWPFSGYSSNEDNCVQSIAADSSGYVYFSTMANAGGTPDVYRSHAAWTSTTPSLSWDLVNSGLPAGAGPAALAWFAQAGKMGLLVSYNTSPRVYTLSGSTWSALAYQPPTSHWDPRVLANPGQNQLLIGLDLPFQTTDFTTTPWSTFYFSPMHADVRSMYFDNSLGYMWATTDGSASSGVYTNLARWSWHVGSAPSSPATINVTGSGGLPVYQAYYQEATSSPNGIRTFVGAQDNGSICTDDGTNWSTAGAPPGGGSGDLFAMVVAPSDPDRAYARSGDPNQFARSTNAGPASSTCADVTWNSVSVSGIAYPTYLWAEHSMAVNPTNENALYIVGPHNVTYIADAQDTPPTQVTYSANLPGDGVSIYVDSSGVIYAGTVGHGAYYSNNNGGSWNAWGLNTNPPTAIMSIAYSSSGGGTWFMATTSGLYRNQAGGGWTLQTGGNGYTVSDVAVDPTCPSRVFAAFGFVAQLGQHRGGVQFSSDTGTNWTSITPGIDLHESPIASLQVDPAYPQFVMAGSYGLGAWFYYDGSYSCP